jgi:hypothetical protein
MRWEKWVGNDSKEGSFLPASGERRVSVIDPREQYDDLHETESGRVVDPERFAEYADSEVAASGWLVLTLAVDDDGRVLLIQQPWADGWMLPGGARTPEESLDSAATRELVEETGVEAEPIRPHSVDEFAVEREPGKRQAGPQ